MTTESLDTTTHERSANPLSGSENIAVAMYELQTDDPKTLEAMQRAFVAINQNQGDIYGDKLALSELDMLGLEDVDSRARDIICRLNTEARIKEGRPPMTFGTAIARYIEAHAETDGTQEVATRLIDTPSIDDCATVLKRIEYALAAFENAVRTVPNARTELFKQEVTDMRDMRDALYEKMRTLSVEHDAKTTQAKQDSEAQERLKAARDSVDTLHNANHEHRPASLEAETARLGGILNRVQTHLRDSVVGQFSFARDFDAQTLQSFNEDLWRLHRDNQKADRAEYRRKLDALAESYKKRT